MSEEKDQNKAKGGKARAASMSPEERKAQARKAALARWDADIPQASHEGSFNIGNATISAAVLPNGKRLITQATFLRALGRSRSPKAGTGVLSTVDGVPFFLQAESLKPFISTELLASTTPIFYLSESSGRGVGYDAELLPKVCEVYLRFRDDCLMKKGKVPANYKHIVQACDILIRGLANVGIVALVDEATGYQYDRARFALTEILEKFISKELLKWVKTFPDEFYYHIYRLKGWKASENPSQRTPLLGKITNDLVYERLAPGVLKELQRVTPRDEKGRLKHKLHRRLTEDIGHPKLREHLASEITLLRIFDDGEWNTFYKALNRALPKQAKLPLFDKLDGLEKEE
ncbi:MAG: P63C domain-containing protein [Blastocatellia bacterium]|nr:P63C domain-containing protein [Blastocatellia bacterium]